MRCVHYYGVRYPGFTTMRSLKASTRAYTVSRILILTALQYYQYPLRSQDVRDLERRFAGNISQLVYQSLRNSSLYYKGE